MRHNSIRTYQLAVVQNKLDAEIEREKSRNIQDNARLLRLKKLRLAVKDQLAGHLPATRFNIGA